MASKETRQKELTRLYKKHGSLKASAVVQAAKPKNSPLHDEFEWDDAIAGEQYRMFQARRLISSTVIIKETGAKERFINIPVRSPDTPTAVDIGREGEYRLASDVAANDDDYHDSLRQLNAQLRAVAHKVQALKNARGIKTSMLDVLRDAVNTARDTVRLMLRDVA